MTYRNYNITEDTHGDHLLMAHPENVDPQHEYEVRFDHHFYVGNCLFADSEEEIRLLIDERLGLNLSIPL